MPRKSSSKTSKADAQGFFQTSEASTELPTEEQLYLPAGFLASHFPKPGSAEARKMTAISGRRCSELYTKPGPLGCLVRTLLESSRWNSTECFLTWKVKATPSKRLLFQLAPSMPNIDETEFGLWPTATAQDAANNAGPSQSERNTLPLNAAVGGSLNPMWVELLMGFPAGWTKLKEK